MVSDKSPRGERELVRRIGAVLQETALASARGLAGSAVGAPLVGFGDDMAALGPAAPELLWTVDMLMDGVDFDSAVHSWRAIGRKAMAVNLSDCAAMAATPIAALVAVALDNRLDMDQALELLRGAAEFGAAYNCPVVGGDTNSWAAATVISVSVAARRRPGCGPVRRDGARPGDGIWLTGRVGGSLLGRHMRCEPRLAVAEAIARDLHPHAMIDISDGLALDLTRILEASGCGAVLEEAGLAAAIHPDARQMAERDGRTPREHALHDGEDFELIVVLPQSAARAAAEALGLLEIGRTVADAGLWLETSIGREPIAPAGWEHFR